MAIKKWTKAHRANFKRTMKAKRAAAANRSARKVKALKPARGYSVHGNGAREIMVMDDNGRLMPYRLQTVRAYVRVSDADQA